MGIGMHTMYHEDLSIPSTYGHWQKSAFLSF
jgi:hypothetical protein